MGINGFLGSRIRSVAQTTSVQLTIGVVLPVGVKEKDMKDIEKLREKAAKANKELRDAEDKIVQETSLPMLRKSVGKCFKFINSYGGSYERWPLYIKIVSIDEKTLSFNTIEFQKTSLELAEAKLDKKWNFRGESYFNDSNYIEISKSEFNKARSNFKKLLMKILDS